MQVIIPRLLLLAALVATAPALAADKPNKPAKPKTITIVVPFTHGGPTDEIAQILAETMGNALKQKVVEKNIVGAGGTLGAEQVAKAKPDGTTLLLTNIGHATSASLYRKLRYDPVKSFEPIGLVADVPMTLVAKPKLPAENFKELLAYIQGNPGKVTYGHAGIGSASHLCGLLFMSAIKTNFATVPYNGTAEAMADLVAGRFDLMCDQTSNTLEPIKAGKIKVFGVTSKSRLPNLPAPTLIEDGLPGFELIVWHGLYAPKGTPKPVIDKLAAALQQALQDPKLKAKFAEVGAAPAVQDKARPQALRARLTAEVDKWKPIIKKAAVYAD